MRVITFGTILGLLTATGCNKQNEVSLDSLENTTNELETDAYEDWKNFKNALSNRLNKIEEKLEIAKNSGEKRTTNAARELEKEYNQFKYEVEKAAKKMDLNWKDFKVETEIKLNQLEQKIEKVYRQL